MKPKSLCLCSQEPTSLLYPEQMNPVHTIPSCFSKIHCNIFLSISRSFYQSLSFTFPIQTLYAFLLRAMRATCPRLPHPFVTSCLLVQEIFLHGLFSNIHRILSALNMTGKISHACEATCFIIQSDICKEVTMMKVVMITKVVM